MTQRIPLDGWDEFVQSLHREHDRNLTPMDYIEAMYHHLVFVQGDIDYIAERLTNTGPKPQVISAEELARQHNLVPVENEEVTA